MKRFFEKYSLELNLILTVLFLVAAVLSWFEYFESQKGRSMMRGIMFSIFFILRGAKLYSLWAKRKQIVNAHYVGLENEKHLE